MKLEDQVCSLELSKRLNELRVDVEGMFVWRRDTDGIVELEINSHVGYTLPTSELYAYTVAELGEMLPFEFASCNNQDGWYCWDDIALEIRNRKLVPPIKQQKTEADARAEMLIYLIRHRQIIPSP